jgi:hypothetical protein
VTARTLQNRLLIATALWRDSTDEPLPRLDPGDPADQIQQLELMVVEMLCREATPQSAREVADKTWDLVYDRPEGDPVRQRVVRCHEALARLGAAER